MKQESHIAGLLSMSHQVLENEPVSMVKVIDCKQVKLMCGVGTAYPVLKDGSDPGS